MITHSSAKAKTPTEMPEFMTFLFLSSELRACVAVGTAVWASVSRENEATWEVVVAGVSLIKVVCSGMAVPVIAELVALEIVVASVEFA